MRRSYSRRTRLRGGLRTPGLGLPRGLEPIFLHSAIKSAAAQSQSFRGLTHIALTPLQCLPDQDGFHRFQAEFFQVLALLAGHIETQIGSLDLAAPAHEDCALQRMLQPAHIARPGVLHEQLQSRGLETLNRTPVARRITGKEVYGKSRDIFSSLSKRRDVKRTI